MNYLSISPDNKILKLSNTSGSVLRKFRILYVLSSGYSQSASLLAHNRITAPQFIRRSLHSSWYKQVPTHCLLLFATSAGDLLDSVKINRLHLMNHPILPPNSPAIIILWNPMIVNTFPPRKNFVCTQNFKTHIFSHCQCTAQKNNSFCVHLQDT